MRIVLAFLMTVSFGAPVQAAKAPPLSPLRRTALTMTQFQKLSPNMQVFYIHYAMRMMALLESTQNPTEFYVNLKQVKPTPGQKLKKPKKSSSKSTSWMEYILPKAHALAPLLFGLGYAAVRVAPYALRASKAVYPHIRNAFTGVSTSRALVPYAGSGAGKALVAANPVATSSGKAIVKAGERAVVQSSRNNAKVATRRNGFDRSGAETFISEKEALEMAAAARTAGYRQGATRASVATAAATVVIEGLGSTFEMIGSNSAAATTAATNTADTAAATESNNRIIAGTGDYKKDGAPCIFGGYGTQYRSHSDGRVTCPAPEQAYACEPASEPMFACNTFGIESPIVRAAGCVPLFNEAGNLNDLTIRCTESISAALEQELADGEGVKVDADELNKLLNDLQAAINNYEAENGPYETTKNYCKDSNAINRGRQKGECEAIAQLLAVYKDAHDGLMPRSSGNSGSSTSTQ